jgi:putative hemolysin
MYELLIYAIISGLFVLAGYLISVFSNAVYIDPEEIETLFPELSEHRRNQLQRLISDPRAFVQMAFLGRISSALFLGILSLLCARQLTRALEVPPVAVYIVLIAAFWSASLVFFIYLPRRVAPGKAKVRLMRFLPLINLVYLITEPIIRILGHLTIRRRAEDVTEEQKDDIVERAIESLAESSGISDPIIEEDEKEMIHQIFQLDVTDVEEIMIPRINLVAIDKNASIDEIRLLVQENGYSRYPVFDGNIDNIIGILKVKDLLTLDESRLQHFVLEDHIREPLRVGEHKKIDQLLADFKRTRTHMAIVMDEFGGTSGLVTLEDILEEIVGEIEDEHESEKEQAITRLENGSLEVSGACPLEDLADELDIELHQEEFETVGGMIYDMVGSVPIEGTFLTWENCRLRVLEVDGQRINKILVIPNPPPAT